MKDLSCRLARLKRPMRAVVCAALCGLAAHAQPTITNIFPNGAYQFQYSPTLSFTANSAAGITNVTVALTVTSLPGVAYLEDLSVGDGLTVSGPATSELVSASLTSNTLYSAVISVTDANGLSASANVGFDTIIPSYIFEAEDWNYNGGSFIDNPQTNKYAGLASVSGTDYNNASSGSGTASYRPQGMETEGASDVPRLPYIGTTNIDYDVGYGTPGGWANYTRHFPAGLYNVYGRLSDGGSAQADTASMSIVSGNAQFIGTAPFVFGDKVTGWQTYRFYPLIDASSNLVQLTNDGTASTIQVLSDGGSYNANFYMLVPANTNTHAAAATFSNFSPDGTTQFQNTNALTFTVNSSVGVLPQDLIVQVTATNLIGQGSIKTYTQANGLTISGTPNALNVSLPLTSNTTYSVFAQAVDENGNPGSQSIKFDTIVPIYTFEAEDFDYNGGQYFDNPQTNAYYGLDGVSNIDWYVDDPTSGSHGYRQSDTGFGPETENPNGEDIPREAFTNSAILLPDGLPPTDYDVGFNDPANWENYTRHYPAGTYNVYMRAANGNGGGGSATLNFVTSGVGTTNQTLQQLGTFAVPPTGGWANPFVFVGLKDANGALIKVTFSGGVQTLRVSGPSSCNANFYMLQPADTTLPIITNLYPNGAYQFQQTNTLSFTVLSSQGIAASGITLTLNGASVPLTIGGTATSRTVSYTGLVPNTPLYSATISIVTMGGVTGGKSFTFDTFAPNNYQWESGDYDYTSNGVSGLYFDNPQFDRYNGLVATPGIDEQEVTGGAPIAEDVYRPTPDGSTILVCTQGGGDVARLQFGNNPTWRINWFGYGDFCNYTRHYPAGSYNVLARFTEGGGESSATLYKVTAGYGTANQTTSLLGTFTIPENGWNAWEWETLMNGSSPAVVTFDGSRTTLQLGGPLADDGQTINAGFFMLMPASGSSSSGPTITATPAAGGNINLSFATVTGSNYQVVYKNSLSDPTWTPLNTPIAGNNAVQSFQFATTGSQRFYQIQVQ